MGSPCAKYQVRELTRADECACAEFLDNVERSDLRERFAHVGVGPSALLTSDRPETHAAALGAFAGSDALIEVARAACLRRRRSCDHRAIRLQAQGRGLLPDEQGHRTRARCASNAPHRLCSPAKCASERAGAKTRHSLRQFGQLFGRNHPASRMRWDRAPGDDIREEPDPEDGRTRQTPAVAPGSLFWHSRRACKWSQLVV
jgi:hypothetical protein